MKPTCHPRSSLGLAACLFAAMGLPLLAEQVSIPLTNAGFETQILADDGSAGNVPGWSYVGLSTLTAWNPPASFYPGEAPEGNNIGDIYLSPPYSGASQIVNRPEAQVQPNTTYFLQVKVGRNALDPFDGYVIQLLADGVVLAQDDNSVTPPLGGFVIVTLKYAYDAAIHSALVGKPIEIRLLTKGLQNGSGDVGFDDVRMSYETTSAVAKHGGPYRLSEGSPLNLNATGSLPALGANSIVSYEWDLNSSDNGGVFNANYTGVTPTAIPYATLTGTYAMAYGDNTIRLRVTDDMANTAIGETVVTIYPLRSYIGPNTTGGTERWTVASNWTGTAVPSGAVDVSIPASKLVTSNSAIAPLYTGNLTFGTNASLQVGWLTSVPEVYNCLGTPGQTVINMASGSSLSIRAGATPVVPAITMTGNASITLGSSTQSGANAQFNYPITGSYRLSLYGNNRSKCLANFNTANTMNEIYAAGAAYVDGGVSVIGNAPGSLGRGNLTFMALSGGGNSAVVIINANDCMSDNATLSMNGNTSPKITMNASDTISRLVINGQQMASGTYGSSTSSAANKVTWMAGTGVLTVTDGPQKYWDINDVTAGAGGAAPAGNWDASNYWSDSPDGTATTASWISGKSAVFAAGADATDPYTVTVGNPSTITVTKSKSFAGNTGGANALVNKTEAGWTLDSGNAVAILFSGKNVTSFSATYAGQAMTVVSAKDTNNVYNGIAYIIGDGLPTSGDVVMNATYGFVNSNTWLRYAYTVLSLSNVNSAGTAVSRLATPWTTTYTTAANNSYILGVASNNTWQNSPISVTGNPTQIAYQSNPGYYNTLHAHGEVATAGSSTDTYTGTITGIVTLPLNAKGTANPLLNGQKISGLGFEEGAVTLAGQLLQLQNNSKFNIDAAASAVIQNQVSGIGTSQLIKKGAGTLTLSNSSNNYPGSTWLDNGTLRLGINNALPSGSALNIGGDAAGITATLDLNGYNNTLPSINFKGSTTTSAAAITTSAGTLTLGGNVTYTATNHPLGATISGNLALGASTRIFDIEDSNNTTEELTISAVISGSGGLTKNGYGALVLSGNNSYTGTTTAHTGLLVLAGADNSLATGAVEVEDTASLRIDAVGAINGSGQNVLIKSGGLAYFGPGFGAGNIPTALATRFNPASVGVVAVDNYSTANFDFGSANLNTFLGARSDVNYSGTFTPYSGNYRIGGGAGTITLTGLNALTGSNTLTVGGRVIIANANNMSGATTVNEGARLQIGIGGTAGALSSSAITNNGVLTFKSSGTLTQGTSFQSPLAGTGVVEQAGSGNLVLNAANTLSGGFNLLSGGLVLGHASALGSGTLSLFAGTLDATAPLTLGSNNPISLLGSFSYGGTANLNMGTGAVSNFGNYTLTLGGSGKTLTFGGTVTNWSGDDQTLTVNGAGNTLVLGSYKYSNNPNATNVAMTFGGTGNITFTGIIDDWSIDVNNYNNGTLTKVGSGTLTFTANNNYTGTTTVTAGVLDIPSGSQKSKIIVNNGGTIAFTLGSTITSTKALVLNAGHKVRINGNPTLASYTLMTASSVQATTPTLETDIPGYHLAVSGSSLLLTQDADVTAPNLVSITDSASGTPRQSLVNTPITFTVTFNEDISTNVNDTVEAADFNNSGSATIAVGTPTRVDATTYTVVVTPSTTGTLILRIPTTAVIKDVAGNSLVVNPALVDDTTIQITSFSDWSGGAAFAADTNGDGITNGIAWYLGAADVNEDALAIAPRIDEDTANNAIVFSFRRSDDAVTAGAVGTVKYSSALSNLPAGWTDATHNGSTIVVTTYNDYYGAGTDLVEVRISRTLANNGKMFATLTVTPPP